MTRKRIALLGAMMVFGCEAARPPSPPPPQAEDLRKTLSVSRSHADDSSALTSAQAIVAGYKRLKLMTPVSVAVDMPMVSACASVYQPNLETSAKRYGPHAKSYLTIYMNAAAADAFERDRSAYPVGAVVVKEKSRNGNGQDGIGGMIKRAAGYDPDNGDWEYFYVDPETPIETGRMTSCVRCHTAAAASDYVFGQWATHAKRVKP